MPGRKANGTGDTDAENLPELTVPEVPAAPGDSTLKGLLGERYETVDRLGAGAFGEVYRAHDLVLGRDVAIKRVRLESFVEPAQLEEVKQRFLREAQVAARLRHPNIVTTHDIVSSPKASFIVMELIEGRTLQSLLDERGRLAAAESLRLLRQVAAALDHAHECRVIHRDVKPANIMIEPSGHVKVMDFGIAKAEAGGNLTATGLIVGTPNYMSPEQARGGKVDARSDLFSLGCVLYECLTGTKPFEAETVTAILLRIVTEEPPPVDHEATGLPRAVDDVLRRAMAKNPAGRFGSAREMMDALEAATGSGAPALTALPRAGGAGSGARDGFTVVARGGVAARGSQQRHRQRLALVAAIGVALAAGGSWLAFSNRDRPRAGTLVVEEPVGVFGRLLGRQPHLRITVPEGTDLRLALERSLSSETAAVGAAVSAETTAAVRIEGVEAVPLGSRLSGRVTHAAPAAQADGRGELTIEFGVLRLPDGSRYDLRTKPLVLRAPAHPHKKENALLSGLSEVGALVGDLLSGRKGTASGGGAGTVAAEKGREVTLPPGAPLSVETARRLVLTRPVKP